MGQIIKRATSEPSRIPPLSMLLIKLGLKARRRHGDRQQRLDLRRFPREAYKGPLNWVKINRADVLFTKAGVGVRALQRRSLLRADVERRGVLPDMYIKSEVVQI